MVKYAMYKHGILFPLKSLGLLTLTHPQFRSKSYKKNFLDTQVSLEPTPVSW